MCDLSNAGTLSCSKTGREVSIGYGYSDKFSISNRRTIVGNLNPGAMVYDALPSSDDAVIIDNGEGYAGPFDFPDYRGSTQLNAIWINYVNGPYIWLKGNKYVSSDCKALNQSNVTRF